MNRMLKASVASVVLSGCLFAADWPQWRGTSRDGVSADQGLLKEWPKSGPPLRWKVTDLGTGYSAPTVTRGKLFVQTTEGNSELAVALDEKTGKKLWTTKIGQVGVNRGPQYPGTRATPSVDREKLYCLASDGQLACLTLEGKIVWQKNIKTEFDGEIGNWAYSESLLVDGDKVICTPGGKTATLAALNKNTGETVWKSAFPGGDQAEYASIMPIEAAGRKQYVQYLRKALIGVDAKTGEFLWQYTRPGRTEGRGASSFTPIVSGNKIFVAGSLVGGGAIELVPDGQGVAVKELYFSKDLSVGYGGAILYKGHIYSTSRTGMYCVDFTTGKLKWTERGVGAASLCLADGKIYARGYDSGEIALVEPSPEEYLEISRFKQPEKSRIQGWTHPIVANGGFYVRDQNALLCFDVKAEKQ